MSEQHDCHVKAWTVEWIINLMWLRELMRQRAGQGFIK